jgi:hydrogenase maturation factor
MSDLSSSTSGTTLALAAPAGGPEPVSEAADALAILSLALARRLGAGATLWCVSPGALHHARHVAVEFVHPVIVGKRALPAVAVDDADPLGALRTLVRPGDVILAIAPGDDPVTASVLRRGDAWGVTTALIATGGTAPSGAPQHVVAIGADPHDADIVLAYHLLWELTHVVFEHPGLLREPAAECTDDVCITCADSGTLVEVCRLVDEHRAIVLAGGHEEEVDVSLVEGGPGDLLLVHAGVAIAAIDDPAGRGERP